LTAAAADPNTSRLIPIIKTVKEKISDKLKPPKPSALASSSSSATDCEVEVEIVGQVEDKNGQGQKS
jgi:hypothetical protein